MGRPTFLFALRGVVTYTVYVAFYTYVYLRKGGTPRYVGKGKNRRAYRSEPGHRPPKDRARIIIQDWPDEATAFAFEMYLIDFWGRSDLGGCLQNRTHGGDGSLGHRHSSRTRKQMSVSQQQRRAAEPPTKRSDESCKRISAGRKGKHVGKGSGMGGKHHAAETRERIGAALRGRLLSPQTRAKISAARKGMLFSDEHKRNLSLARRAQLAVKLTIDAHS